MAYIDGATIKGTDYEFQDTGARQALETKAENDGYYESLTAGQAEQLVSTVGIEDKVPYNFRTAGGSADIGDRLTEKIVGGTIAWNQLAKGRFSSIGGNLSQDGDTISYTVTSVAENESQNYYNYVIDSNTPHIPQNHVVLMSVQVKPSKTRKIYMYLLRLAGTGANNSFSKLCTEGVWNSLSGILRVPVSEGTTYGKMQLALNVTTENSMAVGDVEQFKNFMYFDLTQMFGSTIADYIYSLEQATAGAGIAWFRHLFPKPYYEYNAGELMSVQTSAHEMTGFNQWDEEWEVGALDVNSGGLLTVSTYLRSKNYIRVIPNVTYYRGTVYLSDFRIFMYDGDKAYVGSLAMASAGTFSIPSGVEYIKFHKNGATYSNNICINLSWDGERDGEYEAYTEHVYPLDDSLTLRGIPKLDSNNELYYDGDEYESDGTVTRKYGVVDLGTLDWLWYSQYKFYSVSINGKLLGVTNLFTSKFDIKPGPWDGSDPTEDIVWGNGSNGTIYIRTTTSYANAAAFKAAMSGVMLIYELATPTTETADPFQSPQIVNDFGTEEYVDAGVTSETRDVAIPAGHVTQYQNNLRAKLEMAPASPEGDGDYIVRQTNGENSYVPLVIPTELPQKPSEDGVFLLKATVTNGTAVLSWEAQT